MPRGGANFTSQELAQVLSHYDIGIIQQIKPLIAGNRRAPKKIVVSDKGKFLLKRRAPGKEDLYRVAFAHSVQTHLATKNFPVAKVIPTKTEQNTALKLDHHIYELFEYVPGVRFDGSLESVCDAGRLLAEFHLNLVGFDYQPKTLRGSFHDSASVRGHLKSIGSEKSTTNSDRQLRQTAESLSLYYNQSSTRVNQLDFDEWPEQIIHGDWHPGNMLFYARKAVAILDFDSLKIASPTTDLANGMLQFSIVGGRPNPADWPDYLDQSKLVRFLRGYCEIIKPGKIQLDALLDLMIETIIAEAVLPIAATGFFGHLSGKDFLKMIYRKCKWMDDHRQLLLDAMHHSPEGL